MTADQHDPDQGGIVPPAILRRIRALKVLDRLEEDGVVLASLDDGVFGAVYGHHGRLDQDEAVSQMADALDVVLGEVED